MPSVAPSAPPPKTDEPVTPSRRRGTLLVVDDEEGPRQSLRVVFKDEYEILLSTGGPTLRIWGNLDAASEPQSAELQMQDWGTPWTDVRLSAEDEETLVAYCREFYFGE